MCPYYGEECFCLSPKKFTGLLCHLFYFFFSSPSVSILSRTFEPLCGIVAWSWLGSLDPFCHHGQLANPPPPPLPLPFTSPTIPPYHHHHHHILPVGATRSSESSTTGWLDGCLSDGGLCVCVRAAGGGGYTFVCRSWIRIGARCRGAFCRPLPVLRLPDTDPCGGIRCLGPTGAEQAPTKKKETVDGGVTIRASRFSFRERRFGLEYARSLTPTGSSSPGVGLFEDTALSGGAVSQGLSWKPTRISPSFTLPGLVHCARWPRFSPVIR